MYSKMGRYISNKVIKYNKTASSPDKIAKILAPPPYEYLKSINEKSPNKTSSQAQLGTFSKEKNRFSQE